MTSLRQFLLVVVFFVAQMVANAHAVSHELGNEGGLPPSACELCLATHNFGSALPGIAVLPPVAEPVLVPEVLDYNGRGQLPPPCACQRAPPSF